METPIEFKAWTIVFENHLRAEHDDKKANDNVMDCFNAIMKSISANYVSKSEAHTKEDVIEAHFQALQESHNVGTFNYQKSKDYYSTQFPNHPNKDKEK